MEAFSLLKYWRGGGVGGGIGGSGVGGGDFGVNPRATTIVTAVTHNTVETDDDDDDDGPFFDLEFAVPDEDEGEDKEEKKEINGTDSEAQNDEEVESSDDEEEEEDEDGTDGEREFNFTLSSGSSNDRTDHNLVLSPSDDLFFKGRLVPIESSSLVFNGAEANNPKPPQFRVSLLKSATKFRVFMLGSKKSKMNSNNDNIAAEKTNEKPEAGGNGSTASAAAAAAAASATPKQQEESKQNKFFTVKFKVEEVPLVSLFSRENSKSIKSQKQSNSNSTGEESTASSDEKQRFSKDVMQKYLKKVKPLYIRVSKRYGEKLRFSGQLSLGSGLKASASASPSPSTATASASVPLKSSAVKSSSGDKSQPAETESVEAPAASNMKSVKQGNLPAGLRVVCKHLGKSRSASSAAVAAAPPGTVLSRRRDDSLLQQQDGIQSAILHCKRSFNASRDSDSSLLSRSVSDPSREKSLEFCRKSSDHEGKKVPVFEK